MGIYNSRNSFILLNLTCSISPFSIYNSRNSFILLNLFGKDSAGNIYNSRNSFILLNKDYRKNVVKSTIVEILLYYLTVYVTLVNNMNLQ